MRPRSPAPAARSAEVVHGGDVGHDVLGEVQYGGDSYAALGGRVFSIVDPVEAWQLSDLESALAAFLVHRDYRDFYERQGGTMYGKVVYRHDLTFNASLSDERWMPRDLHNPFSLFRNEADWRPNPVMDAGKLHVAEIGAAFDTRNTPKDPWSGWLIKAKVEGGRGTLTALAPTTQGRSDPVGSALHYTRGFLDARRYNRLSPNAQLNLRVVLGGWMGGDELPLERRLSVDGPGALPGFDFRAIRPGRTDVGTCTVSPTLLGPTECDRVALTQIEYRGALHFGANGFGDRIRSHTSDFSMTEAVVGDVPPGRGSGLDGGPRARPDRLGLRIRSERAASPLSTCPGPTSVSDWTSGGLASTRPRRSPIRTST